MRVCARVCICGCRQQGNTGSKPLHQQNPPSVNWRCRLAQADLYNGRTMAAAIVVHNHTVSILPCRHLATNSKLESTKLCTQNVTNTLCLYTTPGYLTDRNSSVATLHYAIIHTHTHLTALFLGLPGGAGTRKLKPIWILLEQKTVSGSGISWAICKSAPRSRQTTMPALHCSVSTGRMPFLPPNQQRQSTEGTTPANQI